MSKANDKLMHKNHKDMREHNQPITILTPTDNKTTRQVIRQKGKWDRLHNFSTGANVENNTRKNKQENLKQTVKQKQNRALETEHA